MNRNIFVLIASMILLSSCVSTYVVPSDAAKASLIFEYENDSRGSTGRHVNLYNYNAQGCEGEKTLVKGKAFAGDSGTFEPTNILANEPFIFEASHGESRMALNLGCNIAGYFTPLEGEQYSLKYISEEQVTKCRVEVTDSSQRPVDVTYPSYSCIAGPDGLIRNGQPTRIIW